MTAYNLIVISVLCAFASGCVTADLSGNDKSKPPSSIVIEGDTDACEDGKSSMRVEVIVSGDRRTVSALCVQAFSDTFLAKSGVSCAINAGMCSGYFPQEEFIVSCDDGQSAAVDVDCRDTH